MQTAVTPFNDELAGQSQEVPRLSHERRYREALRALAVVDAFVVAHSDLEFREFFLRLQRLAAWHDLLANLDALHG